MRWRTWGQFLYRLSTILDVQNTAFIVPVQDRYGDASGIFPCPPSMCEVVQYNDEPWLRYQFVTGAIRIHRDEILRSNDKISVC